MGSLGVVGADDFQVAGGVGGDLGCWGFGSTRSAPTPRAKAPASRNSRAEARETPPVGISSTWGRGALTA